MLRFLARFVGIWAVAGALVMAVVDGAKSIAASEPTLTRLAETWLILGGNPAAATGLPWPLDAALTSLANAPTAAVLAAAGLLLLAAGRRRRRAFPGEFAV